MASKENISNIKRFQRRKYLNIGIIIFGIIFIYLVITVVQYLTKPRIMPYEVRQGSILKDNAYTGLALREETIVHTEAGGYINYYTQDNSKVRNGTNIYTLSNEKLDISSDFSEQEVTLREEEKQALALKMEAFSENFQTTLFSDTYVLKNNMKEILQDITNQSRVDQLNQVLANGGNRDMTLYPSTDDGIVVYTIDGMEGLQADTITAKDLSKENYKKTEFRDNMHVDAGQPAYKLVTSEEWSLIIQISPETARFLQREKNVRVRFAKDNQYLWANVAIKESEGKMLAILTFHESMIRYVNERYLDIELILEDKSGLKIPKSARTEKEFYIVPKTYLTQGGNNGSQGVMCQTKDKNGKDKIEFVPVTIYYETEKLVYLDPNAFQNGGTLINTETKDTCALAAKKTLDGVYNINKGYAMFRQVQILCEGDEYYIIEEGNSYGLSNYDRIALDSKGIKENDIVF